MNCIDYYNSDQTLIRRVKAIKINDGFYYNIYTWKFTASILEEQYAGVVTYFDRDMALKQLDGFKEWPEYQDFYA